MIGNFRGSYSRRIQRWQSFIPVICLQNHERFQLKTGRWWKFLQGRGEAQGYVRYSRHACPLEWWEGQGCQDMLNMQCDQIKEDLLPSKENTVPQDATGWNDQTVKAGGSFPPEDLFPFLSDVYRMSTEMISRKLRSKVHVCLGL